MVRLLIKRGSAMHTKSLWKKIISIVLMLTIMFVAYATDVDTIFGISQKAYASSYSDKAQSIFELYKSGSALDRNKVSASEIYVFGVFVSNFMMPFKTSMGNMSADTFATKMAQMFFGDAYTAQQYSDMKYTLGLVQNAQSTRARIVNMVTQTPCSLTTILYNFGGFPSAAAAFSNQEGADALYTPQYYTWEGSNNDLNSVVWQVNSPIFDAIIGQIISICPTAAGQYMGNATNQVKALYIDCFGNISDVTGTLIVPACMNPYSFVNGYLDNDRQVHTNIQTFKTVYSDTGSEKFKDLQQAAGTTSKDLNTIMQKAGYAYGWSEGEGTDLTYAYACPIQLPINNAFWMGCMLDPQETYISRTVKVEVNGVETLQRDLVKPFITLPNLWGLVESWTYSTTALLGMSTFDGSELGIYFSPFMISKYSKAYATTAGIGEGVAGQEENLQNDENFPEVWNYAGGVAIPITSVLDHIALFDTYNNFSDTLTESIRVMGMYTNSETGEWWGANPTTGTAVNGILAEWVSIINNLWDNWNYAGSYPSQENLRYAGQIVALQEVDTDSSDTVRNDRYTAAAVMQKLYQIYKYAEDLSSNNKTEPAITYMENLVEAADNAVLVAEDEYKTDSTFVEWIKAFDTELSHDKRIEQFAWAKAENTNNSSASAGSTFAAWGDVCTPDSTDVLGLSDFSVRAILTARSLLAILLDDPSILVTWGDATSQGSLLQMLNGTMFTMEDNSNTTEGTTGTIVQHWGSGGSDVKYGNGADDNNDTTALIYGSSLKKVGLTTGWWGAHSYSAHYFLQKMLLGANRENESKATLHIILTALKDLAFCLVPSTYMIMTSITVAIATTSSFLESRGRAGLKRGTSAIAAAGAALYHKTQDSIDAVNAVAKKSYGLAMFNYANILGTDLSSDEYINYKYTDEEANALQRIKDSSGYTRLLYCYGYKGLEDDLDHFGNTENVGKSDRQQSVANTISAMYGLYWTMYSPYKSLSSSLGAVAKVYTDVDDTMAAEGTTSKTGAFITNDVNLWGGIYYAYMVDIFGLSIDSDGVMSAAKLATHFPEVPENLADADFDASSLFGDMDAEDTEAEAAAKRNEMVDRALELTDTRDSTYRDNLLMRTLNSWLVTTHNAVVGGDSSGSISGIGGGSQYTGFSGYITTSTLSDMPFTSWVMDYYEIIYGVLLLLVILMAICMIITGHRPWRKAILTVLAMSVILMIPRVTIDTAVTVANNAASALYKDRFGFWAYAQHQQYETKLDNATSENEFLLIQNFQQMQDYYASESGVTVKWMSPKKESYFDSFADIKGGQVDGLNLSIFTWLFQGQFRQEIYSTDPLATYLYRPYNDIVMTASALKNKGDGSIDGIVGKTSYGIAGSGTMEIDDSLESGIDRERYEALTRKGVNAYYKKVLTDFDIMPAQMLYSFTDDMYSGSGLYRTDLTLNTTPDTALLQSSLDGGFSVYARGIVNTQATEIAYSDYVSAKDREAYAEAYPNTEQGIGAGKQVGIVKTDEDMSDDNTEKDYNLSLYYLYQESPFYYFYYMFDEMATRLHGDTDTKMHELLVNDAFYHYQDLTTDASGATDKNAVDEGALMDYLDLEGLFTVVIPYLQQSNYYVDEWTDLWGHEVKADSSDAFKADLKNIWKMYAPWVDAMYNCDYSEGTIRAAGTTHKLQDAINPGSYVDIRPMVFGEADMQRNYVTDKDLSVVEARIKRVLENTYTDLMYLNNYAGFDDDVLLAAAAMTATFNFNKEFTDTNFLGENITMYPTGFEVRNFDYDAFLRLTLLNTTGESIFAETDIYTTVINNTSMVTGVIMLINDVIAVYLVPAAKLIVLLLLFFIGLLICINCFLNPPEHLFKSLGKHYFAPFGLFLGALFAHMLIVALFVGEGYTSVVGSRGVTVTTGDPTITILLLALINCIFLYCMYMCIKMLLKSFKETFSNAAAGITGLVASAGALGLAALRGSKRTANSVMRTTKKVVDAPVKAGMRAMTMARNRKAQARASADALKKAGFTGRFKDGGNDTKDFSGDGGLRNSGRAANQKNTAVPSDEAMAKANEIKQQNSTFGARMRQAGDALKDGFTKGRKAVADGFNKGKDTVKKKTAEFKKNTAETMAKAKEMGDGNTAAGLMLMQHEKNEKRREEQRQAQLEKKRLNEEKRLQREKEKDERKVAQKRKGILKRYSDSDRGQKDKAFYDAQYAAAKNSAEGQEAAAREQLVDAEAQLSDLKSERRKSGMNHLLNSMKNGVSSASMKISSARTSVASGMESAANTGRGIKAAFVRIKSENKSSRDAFKDAQKQIRLDTDAEVSALKEQGSQRLTKLMQDASKAPGTGGSSARKKLDAMGAEMMQQEAEAEMLKLQEDSEKQLAKIRAEAEKTARRQEEEIRRMQANQQAMYESDRRQAEQRRNLSEAQHRLASKAQNARRAQAYESRAADNMQRAALQQAELMTNGTAYNPAVAAAPTNAQYAEGTFDFRLRPTNNGKQNQSNRGKGRSNRQNKGANHNTPKSRN